MSDVWLTTTLAVAAGVVAQVAAARAGLPNVVALLVVGFALGPDGLGLLDPEVFASSRATLVNLAVTVILFDGALALDLERLRAHRRPLLLLLTLGSASSMGIGTLAAHVLLGMTWPVASLYGALMIVTGPTVVTPLVGRLPLPRRVRELLVSEGVLIDPLGAIVALVVAEYVLGQNELLEAGSLVVTRLGVGAAAGIVAGLVLAATLRRQLVAERFVNALVLATALLVAALASALSAEAGLMAAVAQGVTLANRKVPAIGRLREFKETLTIVLIGFLFVILTANVRVATVLALGPAGLGVVAALVWIGRPLAVLPATAGSALTRGERAFVAWLCPRGIVAASVAGFFRILLDGSGRSGGEELEALVFLTVAATVAWQGSTAGIAARLFGANLPEASGAVVIGADALGRLLARLLQERGRQVALIDRSGWLCAVARDEGLAVAEADALSVECLEEAGARHAGLVIALTRNDELNALVARQVRDNFDVERVIALTAALPDGAADRDAPFPGDFPGVDAVNHGLSAGRLATEDADVDADAVGRPLRELAYAPGQFALVLERQGAQRGDGRDDRRGRRSRAPARPAGGRND